MKFHIHTILSIFLLHIGFSVYAQNIDSLKQALKTAKHDTTRCNILNLMIEGETDDAIWPKYNDDLKKISEENLGSKDCKSLRNKYTKYLIDAINNQGYLSSVNGDTVQSIIYFKQCVTLHKSINDNIGLALSYIIIGDQFKVIGNYKNAIDQYKKSLEICELIEDKKGIAKAYFSIGGIFDYQGDLPLALEYYHKSLAIEEEMSDKIGVANALNNIGTVYESQHDFQKALEYNNRSLKIYEEINDKFGLGSALNNIGLIYLNSNKLDIALPYFKKSSLIFDQIHDNIGYSYTLYNIGSVYLKQFNYDKALGYFFESLKLKRENQDKRGISITLSKIGEIYFSQNNMKNALLKGTEGIKLAKDVGYPEGIKNNANLLYKVFQKQNKGIEALEMYKLYVIMRDSVNNITSQKAVINQAAKYNYEKKVIADNLKKEQEKKITEAQLKQEKVQRFALYGGLALVLVFAGFMFNRFKVTQKQKLVIEIKEQETQEQNKIITLQKKIVEEKHKEITDSINYAERIQRSFLATKELLNENLKEHFVYFQPKDLVSGDFYWATKLVSSSGDENFVLVTADSTGHGVPGAIMSILNISCLEKAVEEKQLTEPADILNYTRTKIIERLKKDGSIDGGKDGMDCSLISFNLKNNKLSYSAANNPIWIIRKKELLEFSPDKMPVGKYHTNHIPFIQHTIELQSGDMVYALTDGLPDQFGGTKGKKFMYKQLKELLISISHLSMQEQNEKLSVSLNTWKGDMEQVDDITLIGVRI